MKSIAHSTLTPSHQVATVVFVDAGVDNYQQLVDGVIPSAEVFVLDREADGIEQISQVLQQRQDVGAVHIVSHGAPGCLYLGNTQLSLDTFNYYASQLQQWDVANLLLYGCNVAAGDAGAEFIAKLQALTGAEIAASKSLTGSAAKGGNWELEVTTGQLQPALVLQPEVIANYLHTLGYTASSTTFQPINLVPGDPGVVTILSNVDDATAQINLGSNTFRFSGTNYSSLYVSANGLITFGSPEGAFNNTNLSDINQAVIAPLWDDWVTFQDANDQVVYQLRDTTNDGTDDQLVIEWSQVYGYRTSPSSVTFQTILELNTGTTPGDIIYNYVDLDTGDSRSQGASATVGIKNPNGNTSLVSFNNGSNPLIGSSRSIQIETNNANPTDISLSATSINENVAADTSIGTFNTTDSDTGDTFVYRLVSGSGSTDNSAFTIVGNELRINSSPNFEVQNNYSIRVQTDDGFGGTFEEVFTVGVNDINETIYLTPNNDIFRATASADQIDGLEGNDRLYGNAGNDTIQGGDGNDIVYGGDDNDYLLGGNGRDRLYGNAGNDTINGDAGNDILYGGAGDDSLNGGEGRDRLYGDNGNDILLGDMGNDILYGGAGDDLINGGEGSDRLYGNAGSDIFVLASGMGTDTIYDFEDGIDLLGLDRGLSFGQLEITQSGSSTKISITDTGETLATLLRTNATLITEADFTSSFSLV